MDANIVAEQQKIEQQKTVLSYKPVFVHLLSADVPNFFFTCANGVNWVRLLSTDFWRKDTRGNMT